MARKPHSANPHSEPSAKSAAAKLIAKGDRQKILVLHGPNLNLLGTREPGIYGADSLAEVDKRLKKLARDAGAAIDCRQSNHEGGLIELVQGAPASGVSFIIVNAAACTHTSIGLRDAFAAVGIPFIEVHISNVFAREPFRHHSYLADLAVGVVCGLGTQGYEFALRFALTH